jgi:hypothetical protein
MHIVSDMCKYGKPKEANTKVGEKNHKVLAKCIGRCCQKQHKTFAKQVASCLADAFIIEKVASAMQLLDDSDINELEALEESNTDKNQESVKGTHFTIYHNGNKVETKWQSATKKHLLISNEDVIDYIFAYGTILHWISHNIGEYCTILHWILQNIGGYCTILHWILHNIGEYYCTILHWILHNIDDTAQYCI